MDYLFCCPPNGKHIGQKVTIITDLLQLGEKVKYHVWIYLIKQKDSIVSFSEMLGINHK